MTKLVCVGCGLKNEDEPTVCVRKDGGARCADCARQAQEAMPQDDLGKHEVLDRAHVMIGMFDEHICKHPVVLRSPELRLASKRLLEQLSAFYQLAGQDP